MDRSLSAQLSSLWERLMPPYAPEVAMPFRRCLHSPFRSPSVGKTTTQPSPYAEVEAWDAGAPASLEAPTLDRNSRPWAA